MSQPLEARLSDIRRRVRQVLLTYGLSWVASAILGAVLLVGFADWLIHFDDPGVRLIFSLGLLGLSGWMVHRFLWLPLHIPFHDLDIALRIEERHPGLQDSLASTVQFLEGGADPRVGSPALQRSVIEKTLVQVEQLDFSDLVQTRELRRVSALAVCVCLMTAVLVGLNQQETAIALRRLIFPLSAPAWPRRTNLQLLNAEFQPLEFDEQDPLRIARGDTLKLFVENSNGRLPAKVHLEYRFADGKTTSEPLRPTTLRDGKGEVREVAVGQMTAVKGPVWFRAVGGDHADMDWYRLLVIPPPVVESLHVTLTPPSYTQRPIEKLPEGVGHVQAMVGTRVAISAKVSKPLKSAALRVREQERQPAKLSADGKHLATEFVIRDSGIYSYWLDLRDTEGFENSEAPRYEVRGVQDLIPDVYIETPATDMQVTATAEIPLRTVARDDLGLKEVRLKFKLSEEEGAPVATVRLFGGESPGVADRPQQHIAEHLWKIADLKPAHGTRIVFHTEATDDYDLGPEHIGRSISRTLTVVSAEEKTQELAQRQANLLDDLDRAFKLQGQAHEQVSELQLQLEKAGAFRPQDVDMLQRVELSQRQVAAQLAGPSDGIEKRARELLSELRDNKLQDATTERRIEQMVSELARLAGENLPAIEQDLTQTRKLAEPSRTAEERGGEGERGRGGDKETKKPDPKEPGRVGTDAVSKRSVSPSPPLPLSPSLPLSVPLHRVEQNQSAVLESLEEMRQKLAQWRSERDATQDVAEIAATQGELNKQTSELGKQTLTKPREDLSPQEQADLARLAERQKKQAERFEQLESKIQDMIGKLETANPAAAATLKDALDQARQEATAGRMREASGQVGENKIGEAAQTQQQVLDKLQEMEAILHNRHETDGEALVKKLKQAEQELDQLRKDEDELLRKVQKAGEITNTQEREAELKKLQKEQQKLREKVAKAARGLQRLQAQRPGDAASRAAERMQQAEENLAQGESVDAAREQQEALDDLEQAQRELAQERRRAEEQLAREQLERIADELRGMIAREQTVLDETQRLDGLHKGQTSWTRAQLRSLRDLAEVQKGLKQETDKLVETLTAAEVFALALKGASRQMQRAVDLLGERDTGARSQKAESAARQRFVDLIDALKPEKNDKGPKNPGEQQAGEGGDQGGPQSEGIPPLAQLKMLKTLQQELNARTVELSTIREEKGQLTPAGQQELEAIARDQGALADLTRNLTKMAAEAVQEQADEKPSP